MLRRGIKTVSAKLNIIHTNDGESSSTNIVHCFETTKQLFTPEYLYIKNHMIKERNTANCIVINLKEERKIAKEIHANLGLKQKGQGNSAVRSHLGKWRRIPAIIKSIVRNNPSIAYHRIANAIDYFCSASTLQW